MLRRVKLPRKIPRGTKLLRQPRQYRWYIIMGEKSLLGPLMGWNQDLCAVLHREGGKVLHDGICLNMKVADHLVNMPESDQFDNVGVNAGA